MNIKKLITGTAASALVLGSLTTAVFAEAPRPHRPDVVTEEPAGYVFNSEWVTGVSQDGGAKGQSLALGLGGDFAFYAFQNWWDHNLSDVTKVRASFMPSDTTVNLGGSPRFSLELDVEPDGDFDASDVVVYLDPFHCSDPVAGGWDEANFTGDRTDCTIFDSTTASYSSDGIKTAWSSVVAAYPDAKVWFMFLIQDDTTGVNYVDRIMLDSAFFTKAP